MSVRLVAASLVTAQILVSASPVLAGGYFPPPAEKRAYHACLYGHWIADYCRIDARAFSHRAFYDCVVANGGYRGLRLGCACQPFLWFGCF
jgi:hypothetical protein